MNSQDFFPLELADACDEAHGGRAAPESIREMDWEASNIPLRYRNKRLADYPDEFQRLAREFCLKGTGVFVIEGGNGTGKSCAVAAMMAERFNEGLAPGLYISAKYEICPMVRTSRSFRSTTSEFELLRKHYTVPFLVIDEAGKGDDQIIERMFVSNVLSARYDMMLPTAVVTNMTMDELCKMLGVDITSRFHETATVATLDGKDMRYGR